MYAVVAVLIPRAQSRHGENGARSLKWCCILADVGTARPLPCAGAIGLRPRSLIAAGVTIIEAWELAAGPLAVAGIRRAGQDLETGIARPRKPADR